MRADPVITNCDTQPIVACCTARGAGAIGLIRISGIGALHIADRIAQLPSGLLISTVPTHTIHYGFALDAQHKRIDTVMFLVMHGPRTFTGQDTVEITTHNNPFLIDAVIDAALHAGARIAQPGEFSKRAVLAGKMDLLQAEALREFIHAETMQSLKTSYAQLAGSLSSEIAALEQKLLQTMALSDASFEFIEEEEMQFWSTISPLLQEIITQTDRLLALFPLQQQLREGARIALVGSVNAGKSSLFNALIGFNRAIVTPIAGTTRDVIEAGVYRDGEHLTFIDTAGIRQTDDIIEKEGIDRSQAEAAKADLVLLVIDASRGMTSEEMIVYNQLITAHQEKMLIVYTKSDLPSLHTYIPTSTVPSLSVSIHKPDLVENLIKTIDTLRNKKIDSLSGAPYLLNQRHYRLLQALKEKMVITEQAMQQGIHYEILSHHIQDALATLAELTGKSISEASMDAIFRQFCVGK